MNGQSVKRIWRAALIASLAAGNASALINPNFTPIHLVYQSDLILTVRLKSGPTAGLAEFEVDEILKGKKPERVALDLNAAPKPQQEAAAAALCGAGKAALPLFSGSYDKEAVGFLQIHGLWLKMTMGEKQTWKLVCVDNGMPATWNGGSDMLIRCLKYILDYRSDATVPVEAGMLWRSVAEVGKTAGKRPLSAFSVLDVQGDRACCLYAASPDGDILLQGIPGEEKCADLGARMKLGFKSAASAWADFNRDGTLDLLSFDGKGFTLWEQKTGAFSSLAITSDCAMAATAAGLEPISLKKGAPPAVVVGGAYPPILLSWCSAAALEKTALPPFAGEMKDWGPPRRTLVADFDGDAVPDILLLFDKEGLFYKGAPSGAWGAPKPAHAFTTAGGGRTALGDFDADGFLDILVAGAEGAKIFQNLHDGTFVESLAFSGEVSYKTQPEGVWCGVCDFNADSRMDLFFNYGTAAALFYFNRGFRSFGEAPRLESVLVDKIPGSGRCQRAAAFGDFDGDGAEDLALALPDGAIWIAYSDITDARGILCRLPPNAPWQGPVNVTAQCGKLLLGCRTVRPGTTAFLGVPQSGPCTLVWRWPDGSEGARTIVVENKVVAVLLEAGAAARK